MIVYPRMPGRAVWPADTYRRRGRWDTVELVDSGRHHSPHCPRFPGFREQTRSLDKSMETGDCVRGCMDEALYRVTQYEGATLCKREENGPQDSDFYAIVWDEREQRLKKEYYNTTRAGGGGGCRVDATEAVKVKARKWLYSWAVERLTRQAELEAVALKVGRRVRVVSGRKVSPGTEGVVEWYGEGRYGKKRVRIANGDGEHWLDADHCEVIDPHVPGPRSIEVQAERWAESGLWHAPFTSLGYISM